jgi:hypothetical protein
MSANYHLKQPNGAIVTFDSPESIQTSLRMHSRWPSGRYEILQGPPAPMAQMQAGLHWGVAIKDDTGEVGLHPEPPASDG